jgi:hypothetical protein
MEVPYIYICRQHNEPHQALFEKGRERERKNGNIMKGVSLFNTVPFTELPQ